MDGLPEVVSRMYSIFAQNQLLQVHAQGQHCLMFFENIDNIKPHCAHVLVTTNSKQIDYSY